MRVAIAIWKNRIAPLFDATSTCLIAETEGYGKPIKVIHSLEVPPDWCREKVTKLAQEGVNTLICGAISRPCEMHTATQGLELYAFISGEIESVLEAWSAGTLERREFAMPGCDGRPRRRGRQQGRRRGRRRMYNDNWP